MLFRPGAVVNSDKEYLRTVLHALDVILITDLGDSSTGTPVIFQFHDDWNVSVV